MSFAGWRVHSLFVYKEEARNRAKLDYGSSRLGNPAHAHINFRNLIPCGVIHNAGLRQVEDPLERAHRIGGVIAVDAVRRDTRDRRIVLGDAVELLLDLQYFIAGGADIKVVSRP